MAANVVAGTSITTAHSLTLLSEYTHMLDALPLDLSRQFADLRELDAVLSSSAQAVTQKIHELIDLIENDNVSKEVRIKKLSQIGEDVQKLKLGGEDKIRVATQAADSLIGSKAHMSTLLAAVASYDPSFNPSHLYQRTTYPHLPPRPPQDAIPAENGRRRRAAAAASRGQLGGILAAETSPAKSRKRVRDDEDTVPTPRKERDATTTATTTTSRRGGATSSKGRRVEQIQRAQTNPANSPSAESVLSVTSHQVPNARSTVLPATQPAAASRASAVQQEVAPAAEEAEPGDADEGDGGRYCYCQGPSYGEMVGCDEEQCAYEWFHLNCVGLSAAPKSGSWYCDDCKAKRTGKKGRVGKRRGAGASNSNSTNSGGAKSGRGRA